jgi:hypothetical protein
VQVTVDESLGLNWVEKLLRRVHVKHPEPGQSDVERGLSDTEPGQCEAEASWANPVSKLTEAQ